MSRPGRRSEYCFTFRIQKSSLSSSSNFEKNGVIGNLNDEIASKDTTILNLNDEISSKDSTILNLNDEIASMYTIEQLNSAVEEAEQRKDAIISNYDINRDGLLGIQEAIRALQITSDIRK